MYRLLIVGANGFAKELLEAVIQKYPDANLCFYDDMNPNLPEFLFDKFPIIRSGDKASRYFRRIDPGFALGIGNPGLRQELFNKFVQLGGEPQTVISPFAKIGAFRNTLGDGVCVLADAIIESNNKIGVGSLVHVGALVSHDVTTGSFCEISPKANLLGGVTIGNLCSLGTASTILPKITLGHGVVVGAGSVVTKDLSDNLTVVGVPARPVIK